MNNIVKMSKKRKRLTDDQFKQILFINLNKGCKDSSFKTNFYELLRTKYQIGKQRALELHDRYYPEYTDKTSDALISTAISEIQKSVKRNIMTRLDILENLTKIALGNHVRVGAGEQFTPTAAEQIRAMETINRMQGYNEADKLEVTEIKPILTKRMSKK